MSSLRELPFLDRYFALWAFLIPVTSVLLFPAIQGTLPANLMALATLGLVPALRPDAATRFLGKGMIFWACFTALAAASQLVTVLVGPPDISGLPLLEPYYTDRRVLLRGSLFTQSLYLLAGTTTFVFVWSFYRREWDRYILLGSGALAAYGLYEFVFYLLFQQPGDFLSNRVFVAGELVHTGSFFQTMNVAGVTFQRLKSLTGEPSMYAFTVLPYWIYSLHNGWNRLSILLFVTLLMTVSTSAAVGIMAYVLIRLYYVRRLGVVNRYSAAFAGLLVIVGAAAWQVLQPLLDLMVLDKLSLSSGSAVTRLRLMMTNIEFFAEAPWGVKLFGLGFGYVRATDMGSTLLVNTGLVGVALTTLLFFYPVSRLGDSRREIGIKAILIVLYGVMMLAVAEYSYLSLWLFLGIAYREAGLSRRWGRIDGSSAGKRAVPAAVGDGGTALRP